MEKEKSSQLSTMDTFPDMMSYTAPRTRTPRFLAAEMQAPEDKSKLAMQFLTLRCGCSSGLRIPTGCTKSDVSETYRALDKLFNSRQVAKLTR